MEAEIKLSKQDVLDILREHLSSKFKNVKDLKINVGIESVGYGMTEHNSCVFKNVTGKVEM